MATVETTTYRVELDLTEEEYALLYLMLNQPTTKISKLLSLSCQKDINGISYALWGKVRSGVGELESVLSTKFESVLST
tara:strand:- start:1582 stop:1818 length:237 start_codon:yes stop_codon:yes gene_type:complete